MNAIDCIERLSITNIVKANNKYCLVDDNKIPYRVDNTKTSPNNINDFFSFEDLFLNDSLEKYKSIGISVQFSGICGVDIDHCFEEANNFESGDNRAKEIYEIFKDFSYIEFSFSGKGMRVIFKSNPIINYKINYYIKNSNNQVEFYQPTYDEEDNISYRYLTLTGNAIIDNYKDENISRDNQNKVKEFLEKFMKRPKPLKIRSNNEFYNDDRDLLTLMAKVKIRLLKDGLFQDNWFDKAPGYGSNESERDYYLVHYIFDNVTKDPKKIIEIFEQSEFYKSKDSAHKNKWNRNEHFYFYQMYKDMGD